MTITTTWTVERVETTTQGENANVISQVFWRVIASNGTQSGNAYGATLIPYDEDQQFKPFAELDQETVIEWTKAALGAAMVAALEASANNELNKLLNPPVQPTLPWA